MKVSCPCGFSDNVKIQGMSHNQPSGWLPVPGFDGSVVYLCPTCGPKARAHAAEIVKICRTDNVYLPALGED
jgi:hypothetical protein